MGLREGQRALPVEVSQQVEHHKVILREQRLTRKRQLNLAYGLLSLLGTDNACGNGSIAVHGDGVLLSRKDIVAIEAIERAIYLRLEASYEHIVILALLLGHHLALAEDNHTAIVDGQRHRLVGDKEAYGILEAEAICRQRIVICPILLYRLIVGDEVFVRDDSIDDIEGHSVGDVEVVEVVRRGVALSHVVLDHRLILVGKLLRLLNLGGNLAVGTHNLLLAASHIYVVDDVVVLVLDAAARSTHLTCLVRVEHVDDVGHYGPVVDEAILGRWYSEGHTLSIVGRQLHLVDIPLATEVRRVHYPHIGAHALNLLAVPEWEGVVIAKVYDDGILRRRI